MADDLSESLDSLRFLVARPGTFAALYPETTDDMLLQVMIDAMAEAHLEGLLLTYESDIDGLLTPALDSGQIALVILFAAVRFLTAELLNRNISVRYKAGPAEYETAQSSTLLRDLLRRLQDQKDRLIAAVDVYGGARAFYMADQYLTRVVADWAPVHLVSGW
jgi:hypothetical protein